MPLIKGKSKAAFSSNVSAEMNAGKPQKQAVAIAYSQKRKAEHKKKMWRGGSAEKRSGAMSTDLVHRVLSNKYGGSKR